MAPGVPTEPGGLECECEGLGVATAAQWVARRVSEQGAVFGGGKLCPVVGEQERLCLLRSFLVAFALNARFQIVMVWSGSRKWCRIIFAAAWRRCV